MTRKVGIIMRKGERIGEAYVILSAVLFGIMPFLTKMIYEYGGNAFMAAFGRFFTGAIMLAIFMRFRHIPFAIPEKYSWRLFGMSIFYAATPVLLYASYLHIRSGLATALHFTYPATVMLLMTSVFHAKFSGKQLACLICCVLGTTLAASPDGTGDAFGIFASLASGITYAGYIVMLGKNEMEKLPTIAVTFWMSVFAAFEIAAFAFLVGNWTLDGGWRVFMAEAGLGLFSTAMALTLFQKGLLLCGEVRASLLSAFEPLTGIAIGVIVFHEMITRQIAFGMTLVLLSAALLMVPSSVSENNGKTRG